MSNQYERIHRHLTTAETADSAGQVLLALKAVLTEVGNLIDEQLARAVVDEEMSLAAAGKYAGLTENAVGPRLARTARLAPYASPNGRVTAKDVDRARHDKRTNTPLPPARPDKAPMRFKPRRTT